MAAYYNEFDPYAAAWLRNLIAAGHIAPGEVDDRSIVNVRPEDLDGYDQCHFFAGIGGWSLALRLAGWPDERPVWTGSCPCQPFSAAGKRKGTADARHLWPEFRRLIGECSPPVVFGEQVASADGRTWLAGVRADLEDLAYAVGAADLCAAGAGAPHIRQRLWWVADAEHAERRALRRPEQDEHHGQDDGRPEAHGQFGARGALRDPARRLADAMRDGAGHGSADGHRSQGAALGIHGDPSWAGVEPRGGSATGRLADACGDERRPGRDDRADAGRAPEPSGLRAAGGMGDAHVQGRAGEPLGLSGAGHQGDGGFWSDFDLLPCTDGKARRVEPGTFPLAHGVPNRVGRLRAYGNAIVPQVAAEFIAAFAEAA